MKHAIAKEKSLLSSGAPFARQKAGTGKENLTLKGLVSKTDEGAIANVWRNVGVRDQQLLSRLVEQSRLLGMNGRSLQEHFVDWAWQVANLPKDFPTKTTPLRTKIKISVYILSRCNLKEEDCMSILLGNQIEEDLRRSVQKLLVAACPAYAPLEMPLQAL